MCQAEGKGAWRSAIGYVTTRLVASRDQLYQMPCLCPFLNYPPYRCRCRDAKWKMSIGCFSPLSSRALSKGEHLVPKDGKMGSRGGNLALLKFRPCLSSSSLPHSSLVPLSSSLLSDWEMAGETGVYSLGRWAREDRGLLAHMGWHTHTNIACLLQHTCQPVGILQNISIFWHYTWMHEFSA